MYHDLKLQFKSPTINLYFGHHGFIDFVTNLKDYVFNGQLIESGKKEEVNGAPIGILKCDNLPDIELHFLHYSSFEEAKEKWLTRSKRINFDKIFLVIEAKDKHEHTLFDEYSNLPFNKIIFTNCVSDENKSILHMNYYDNYPKGNITSFIGLSSKKGYDTFDFVTNIFNCDKWEKYKSNE